MTDADLLIVILTSLCILFCALLWLSGRQHNKLTAAQDALVEVVTGQLMVKEGRILQLEREARFAFLLAHKKDEAIFEEILPDLNATPEVVEAVHKILANAAIEASEAMPPIHVPEPA